jgi:formyl-CoA transferase
MTAQAPGPLAGLRVIELGHFVAAPFCTRLLGDLGAEVIKIEPPAGDPVRQWGEQHNGHSLWWSVHGRNKRSVALDLKRKEAIGIVLRLVARSDALVENFRPGQLRRFGLGDEALRQARPDLVIAHVSGYGQDGPGRDRAAFGVIGEAVGGLRHLTNHAPGTTNLPPVRVGVSIGDSTAGLYAALGIVAALWQRDRRAGDGRGRTVDVALADSVLSFMEGMLPEYGMLGVVRQPQGARIATAAPTSAYPTKDGGWMLIAANSDPLFARLCETMGRPDLLADPRFQGNRARVQNVEALDAAIGAWSATMTAEALGRVLAEADIPSTLAYTAAEIAADPQFRHRGMVREVADPLHGTVLHPGVVPHLPDDPGGVRWAGRAVGQDTDCVLQEVGGYGAEEVAAFRREGVVR